MTTEPSRHRRLGSWCLTNEWGDGHGGGIASGYMLDDRCRLEFPGIGVYEWSAEGGPVELGLSDVSFVGDRLRDHFERSVQPFVLHTRGVQSLHASAVAGANGVVAISAVSQTGKSTLGYAWATRPGWRQWADDVVAFDLTDVAVRARQLAFSAKLRAATAHHFGETSGLSARFGGEGEPEPLCAVLVLQRAESLRIERLGGSEAFAAVLEHAYCFGLTGSLRRATTETYLALVQRVPVFRVSFAPGLERLDETIDELVALV